MRTPERARGACGVRVGRRKFDFYILIMRFSSRFAPFSSGAEPVPAGGGARELDGAAYGAVVRSPPSTLQPPASPPRSHEHACIVHVFVVPRCCKTKSCVSWAGREGNPGM